MAHNGEVNGVHDSESNVEIQADYLIVGTGPAGASLACFLTQYGKIQTNLLPPHHLILWESLCLWFMLDSEFGPDCVPSAGLTGLIVSQDPSNADTPRAHITNMVALGRWKLSSRSQVLAKSEF